MKLETLLEKITPLPYSHHEKLDAHNQSLGHAVEAQSTTVAELDVTEPPELGGYDAAYLVHCANNFPKLLEALEKAEQAMAALLSAAVMAPQAVVKHPPFLKGITLTDAALAGARSALTQAREVKG